jgi:hypothetical protein
MTDHNRPDFDPAMPPQFRGMTDGAVRDLATSSPYEDERAECDAELVRRARLRNDEFRTPESDANDRRFAEYLAAGGSRALLGTPAEQERHRARVQALRTGRYDDLGDDELREMHHDSSDERIRGRLERENERREAARTAARDARLEHAEADRRDQVAETERRAVGAIVTDAGRRFLAGLKQGIQASAESTPRARRPAPRGKGPVKVRKHTRAGSPVTEHTRKRRS